jgi:hypothetical protein
MSAVKKRMTDAIQNQPEDASYEEILRELAFEQMTSRGLQDSREGKTFSNEKIRRSVAV